jgi:hypothetical protein
MVKYAEPVNANYAATVVRVNTLRELPKLDNVRGVPVFGFQAIVDKSVEVGTLMVFFPAESQLSVEYAYENNLHRHGDRNKVQTETGYLEDSRRVKAIKFMGNQSDGLLMPLSSLQFTGASPSSFDVGDVFDTLNGHEIVRKYLVKQPGEQRIDKNAKKKFTRVESKFMPEHYDTDNYWRNQHVVPAEAQVIVTQKLHGTSIRIGNTIVKRELGWKERLAKRLGIKVAETEFDHVYGSRKVIKDANNPNQDHFYGTDLWSEVGRLVDDRVPENFILYGEVIGYTKDGGAIQKNYTYGLPVGESLLYIYRVAVITNQGRVVDLSWDQVVSFCEEAGLLHVPELWRGKHEDFKVDDWIDIQYHPTFPQAVPLAQGKKFVDEGVVVRAEGKAPYLLKAKSPIFLQHETKMLDEEAVDLEAEESVV